MNSTAQKITFFLLMIYFAGTLSILESDFFLFMCTFIIYGFCISYRCRIDYRFLFSIILFFTVITFITDLIFPSPANLTVVIGTIIRVIFALSAATLLGFKLYDYYYQFIYKMALISIPMYIIQNFYPKLFAQTLLPLAKIITSDVRYSAKIYSYGFHTFHMSIPLRNSGFMWEPGGFGMAIGFALFYGLSIYKFRWRKKLVVLLVAGLTTLSTTFYFSLAILFLFYYYNKHRDNLKKSLLLSLGVFGAIYAFNNLPFMKEKIEFNVEHYNYYTHGGNLEMMSGIGGQAGRLISFAANLKSFIRFPLGHGDNPSFQVTNAFGEIISGANGLGPFMVRYGILGIIFLILSLYKTSSYFKEKYQVRMPELFIFLVLIYLFSNPMYRNPFFLTLLFIPVADKKELIKESKKAPKPKRLANGRF